MRKEEKELSEVESHLAKEIKTNSRLFSSIKQTVKGSKAMLIKRKRKNSEDSIIHCRCCLKSL